VVLIGRLTKDPELRYSASGVAVATFTLAVNRQFSNNQGEKEADFINIVAWRQLAELCANYLKKGSQAGLEGRLQSRSYDNKEGKKVYITEVVADNVQFFGGNNSENTQSNKPSDPFANDSRVIDIKDDDLPF
jgi:single-strand DNA-binding protein